MTAIVLSNPEVQPGDELWLLNHALAVYVLRPREADRYTLVGQAQLYLNDSSTSDVDLVRASYGNFEDDTLVELHYHPHHSGTAGAYPPYQTSRKTTEFLKLGANRLKFFETITA